jgi:type IV pilus assembly protein PilC
MPHFLCRLATDDGRIISEPFFSPSFKECRKHFEEEGYCVLSVKRDWKKIQVPVLSREQKVNEKDFIAFNQELVALIRAGYPILKSINILIQRVKNEKLKEILMLVEREIRGGKALSEAFAEHEGLFSTVYTASLMAGERSGNLAETISRYNIYARTISQTKSRIKTALTYPTILVVFSLILVFILLNFILPRFSSFYADYQAQLPSITRALIAVSLVVQRNMVFILAFLLVLFLAFLQMHKNEKSLIFLDKWKLKTPYGKQIWVESAVSLFCRTLGLLLEGGISLLSAIPLSSRSVPNKYMFSRMKSLPESIKNGESLTESLRKTECFPPLALDMIRIGESSANLEGMLSDVAEVYDERISSRIDAIVSLIQPIIIIFMGLVVAVILLSVYLPIFNIIQVTN